MKTVSIAEAKAHLSELVNGVISGENVTITRRGKPVVEIVAPTVARMPIDIAALKALADSMPYQTEGAGAFMRRIRDEERY